MTVRVLDMGGKVKWFVTGYVVFVDPLYLEEFYARHAQTTTSE